MLPVLNLGRKGTKVLEEIIGEERYILREAERMNISYKKGQ